MIKIIYGEGGTVPCLIPSWIRCCLVAEKRNFTRAAQALSLTQPAVSHHISQLEQELGVRLFVRGNGDLMLTPEGETVLRYVRRMKALEKKMAEELQEAGRRLTRLRIGITHTAESSIVAEVLARYTNENPGISITIVTDNINNLYDMLENFELDLAVVEGRSTRPELSALMLDTDYLVCVLANTHPLSHSSMITLDEIRQEKLILRLPNSETRVRFESALAAIGESIADFQVILEVDNVATIKDLIRKNLGISILARSACMDELRKGKLTALPIENLSMTRETNLVYHRDFAHKETLQDILALYKKQLREYGRA